MTPDAALQAVRRDMFQAFCALLETHDVRYVILSGYGAYPDRIESDVDFMVSEADFDRLPGLLGREGAVPGAQLVQVLRHETTACYYVLARQVGERLAYLQPDACASYRRRGRLWLSSTQVLSSRRRHVAGFWVPAPAVEFEYYFIKRVDKGVVEARHLEALCALQRSDEQGCAQALARLLPPLLAGEAIGAIARHDEAWFGTRRAALYAALQAATLREPLRDRLRHTMCDLHRRWQRVTHPTGLVLAVLGPDGSGKTTVIEHLQRELAPAFRRTRRFHFRPRFGRQLAAGTVSNPHAQPPRSWPSSAAKLAFVVADYAWSWLAVVAPARVRSTLVIFDRYFHDMQVDAARYRLPPASEPVALAAALVPKPDRWLVLTAEPGTLVARKDEITPEAAALLVAGYRCLAARLDNAVLIDTEQDLPQVLSHALASVRDTLAARARRQLPAAERWA